MMTQIYIPQKKKTDLPALIAAICFVLQTLIHFKIRFVYVGYMLPNVINGALKISAELGLAAGLILSDKKLRTAGAAAGTVSAVGCALLYLPLFLGPGKGIPALFTPAPSGILPVTLNYLFCIASWVMVLMICTKPDRNADLKGYAASILFLLGELSLWRWDPNSCSYSSYGSREILFMAARTFSTALTGISAAAEAPYDLHDTKTVPEKTKSIIAAAVFILGAAASFIPVMRIPRGAYIYRYSNMLYPVSELLIASGLLLSKGKPVKAGIYAKIAEILPALFFISSTLNMSDPAVFLWNAGLLYGLLSLTAYVLVLYSLMRPGTAARSKGIYAGLCELLGAYILNIFSGGQFLYFFSPAIYLLHTGAWIIICSCSGYICGPHVRFTPLTTDEAVNIFERES